MIIASNQVFVSLTLTTFSRSGEFKQITFWGGGVYAKWFNSVIAKHSNKADLIQL